MTQLSGPFEGIKVIDVSQWAAMPAAAALLADWGAEVIHLEHPVRGDGQRGLVSGTGVGLVQGSRINYAWEHENRGKKSLAVDLSQEDGQKIIHKLVESVDVFMVNMRPYELERYHLEYSTLSALNPRLVYVGFSGYGARGPDKDRPGYDYAAFWARSGIMAALTEAGLPPGLSRPGFGDHTTSLAIALGVATALFARERTGIGQKVETSLLGTAIWVLALDLMSAFVTSVSVPQVSRTRVPNPLGNTYKTKDDKWLFLCNLQSDLYWPRLCKAIEHEELEHNPRYSSLQARAQNCAELISLLDEVFAGKTLAEWKVRLDQLGGVIWAPVQSPLEMIRDPQAWENEYFVTFEHPVYGHLNMIANPVKLAKTPASIRGPAPEQGQHTEEILLGLGYGWDRISELKKRGVIN